MTTLPVRNNPINYGRVKFTPTGQINYPAGKSNPYHKGNIYTVTLAARFIIGFKVGNKTVWTMRDIVRGVRTHLRMLGMEEAGSFIAQTGVYTHAESNRVVVERSAQIIIVNIFGMSRIEFVKFAKKTGEFLRKNYRQESVIVEVQKNGVTIFAASCTA